MPRPKAKPPRAKPRRATKREFHAFWIELENLGRGYAVWKVADAGWGDGPVLNVGEISRRDGLPEGEVEYEIEMAAFLSGAEEIAARKKSRKVEDEDFPYGDPVEFSDGFSLEKYGPREYAIIAPCGEGTEITGAELRLLAAAIRDLEVSPL